LIGEAMSRDFSEGCVQSGEVDMTVSRIGAVMCALVRARDAEKWP